MDGWIRERERVRERERERGGGVDVRPFRVVLRLYHYSIFYHDHLNIREWEVTGVGGLKAKPNTKLR